MSIITELQGSWFPKGKIPACPLYICRWFWSLSLLILILCSTSNLTKAFAKYGVEHRIRNLSQDKPRMCRDRASKLRFFKFLASNQNELSSSIVYKLFFLRSIAQFFTQIYMNCFEYWNFKKRLKLSKNLKKCKRHFS